LISGLCFPPFSLNSFSLNFFPSTGFLSPSLPFAWGPATPDLRVCAKTIAFFLLIRCESGPLFFVEPRHRHCVFFSCEKLPLLFRQRSLMLLVPRSPFPRYREIFIGPEFLIPLLPRKIVPPHSTWHRGLNHYISLPPPDRTSLGLYLRFPSRVLWPLSPVGVTPFASSFYVKYFLAEALSRTAPSLPNKDADSSPFFSPASPESPFPHLPPASFPTAKAVS